MPYRITPLANGEYYHVYNRGVAKLPTFQGARDYQRFIQTLSYYLGSSDKPKFSAAIKEDFFQKDINPIIDIVSYCLMPNHFHLLVKQIHNNGISEFMRKVGNSYTKYYNKKHERVGPLFQGQFKALHITSNEQLLHVSRYIHLNPIIGYVTKSLENYAWSSYREYMHLQESYLCQKSNILNQFPSSRQYAQFVYDQVDYAKTLDLVKHQLIDFEE